MRLKKGMVFTVEPMLNASPNWQTHLQPDEWTVLTTDGSDSAQFEHTLAVTDEGFDILTQSPKGWLYPPYV
jgi:methionyl aminopeptidase